MARKQRTTVIPISSYKSYDGLTISAALQMLELLDKQRYILVNWLELAGYDPKKENKVDPELIVWLVYNIFGINVKDTKNKTEEVTLARHATRHLLKTYSKMSAKSIALLTGVTDHATVLRSFKMIPDLRKNVEGFAEKLDLCIKKIEPEVSSYGRKKGA